MSWVVVTSALWFGIMTSISPCPLATNIAAIGFISRDVGKIRQVIASGLIYTLGRTLAYLGLAAIVITGLLASSQISLFLQNYLNQILGPLLILAGMLLLGLLTSSASLNLAGAGIQARAAKGGLRWALALGVLFALSFCPVSAGLFFGGLIPLAARHESIFALPIVYGIGTALPVVVFAFIMAFASQHIGRAFSRLVQVERWMRYATGVIFVLAGIYYSLVYVYGVSFPST
ncbi:MAG TPA: aromatic aminobenezylarsenical efflux permease ArsG family transporter [Kiritimatiellia bacterium]|nr:aromatic aminobenezylarsenical efflux permease ArsG family transporter [Kiritimatiellia bacterium]